MERRLFLAYLSLFAAVAMIAVNVVISKYLLAEHMSVLLLLSLRFFFAAALFSVGFLFHPKKFVAEIKVLNRVDWWYLFLQSVCAGALFNLFMLMGLHYTSASVVGIITSALPAMIALFSLIFLRERLGLMMWLCVGFATLGLILMNAMKLIHDHSNNSIYGDLLVILALVPEALYYMLVKMRPIPLSGMVASVLLNLINFLVLLPLSIFFLNMRDIVTCRLEQVILAALIGVASGFFFVFWQYGAKTVRASRAGLVTAMVPIFTVVGAGIFLHESLSLWQFIGMIVILASIIFSARSKVAA